MDEYNKRARATQIEMLTNKPEDLCLEIADRLDHVELAVLVSVLQSGISSRSLLHVYEAILDLDGK